MTRKMDIVYLGHSSFRLRGKSATLVTDPFDPKMVGLKYSGVSADIVTISHDHSDHNQSTLVKDVQKTIFGSGEYEVKGVSIIGIPSFHDDKKGELRGKNTIYVIEMDALRIVHLGDLGHSLSEDTLEDLGTVDILLIPVGGEFTIGPSQAAELVSTIEPSITIPMHYLSEGVNKEVFGKISSVEIFLNEVGLPVAREDKLTIRKDELQEEQKIVVLNIK